MIKGIIFDFGGTLDTGGEHWSHVISDGWKKAGVAADEALFREAYVYGEQELERTLHILPQHNLSDLLDIKIQLELQYLAQTGHFPPAMVEEKAKEIAAYCYSVAKEKISQTSKILAQLSEKYPMVVVSNFYGNLETVLKDLDILKYFKKVIDSAKEGIRKPDSALFEKGIKALGFKAEEVLVVGDSYRHDIIPSQKLGCQTLLLEGKGWEESPLAHEGKSIRELAEILKYLESA